MKWEEGALECVFRELEGGRRGKMQPKYIICIYKNKQVLHLLFFKSNNFTAWMGSISTVYTWKAPLQLRMWWPEVCRLFKPKQTSIAYS